MPFFAQQKQAKDTPPKMKTLYKAASLAMKNKSGQDAAKNSLLQQLPREDLKEKDGTLEGDGAGKAQKEPEKELTVTVQDDRIFVNGEPMKDLNALKVRLALEYRNNVHARLVDDYASWKTYTEVYKVLREEGITPEEERKP